jgi:hypothetical protein
VLTKVFRHYKHSNIHTCITGCILVKVHFLRFSSIQIGGKFKFPCFRSMEVKDFASKFHSLAGKSLGEKRKSLFLLLNNIPSDHDAILASVTATNYLETLFRLELLLKLKRVPELIQVLKSEEEYLPAKLLKNKWFCQKLASLLDEDSTDFANGVLPFTSLVIRQRIIRKLARYGTKLDTVFDEVRARYGIHTARNLLVACSAQKIEDVLKGQGVVLLQSHVELLYRRHPQLFEFYVEKHQNDIEESVMNKIARQDVESFFKMVQTFHLRANLGKRLTRRLLTNFKERIIENADKFSVSLKIKTVVGALSEEEFKRFYFKCFPTSISTLQFGGSSLLYNFINKLDARRYYRLLAEGLEKILKKSIYDFPDLVSESMMEAMDVDEREKWIAIKKKKGESETDLIKFMRVSDAVPLIKNKINVTSSVHSREKLLMLLVETCKINSDMTAFAEALEYVRFRHRNDDQSVLAGFLFQVEFHIPLEKLEERHWDSINALLDLPESADFHDFRVKYVEFLFRKNKLSEEQVLKFLKTKKKIRRDCKVGDKDLQKLLLLKSIELAPKLMEKHEEPHFFDLAVIGSILEWNKEHAEDTISIFGHPRLVESLQESIKQAIECDTHIPDLYRLVPILKEIICTKEESTFRDEIIKTYFLMGFRFYDVQIDAWLLKHQPELVALHFEKFLAHLIHSYHPNIEILNCLKKHSDFSFGERTVNYCVEKIGNNETEEKLFVILAVLMPAETFLRFVAPFCPVSDKIEGSGEDSRVAQRAQSVATSFKYAGSAAVLPDLVKYCKGDFLRYSLESLYYLFYHSPENKLSTFVNELSSKAVSVRKHSIFLTCIVGSVDDVDKLVARFIQNERNVSVQKHLFTAALKYFIKNPSDRFWECVKACMTNLDKNDTESFSTLVNLRQIPSEYQARHVIFVWEILQKTEDTDKNLPRLLSSISAEVFRNFPLEFLLEVITGSFLVSGSSCESAINDFVVLSLTRTHYTAQIMDAIFDVVRKFKETTYDTLEQEKNAREVVHYFVSNLANKLGSEEESLETLREFSQRWHGMFTTTETFKEHLIISFNQLFLEAGKDLTRFSDTIAEFLDNLVSIYGVVIVDVFASELNYSLKSLLRCYAEPNEDFFAFCLNIFKKWDNLVFYLLLIKLLPTKEPSEDDLRRVFHELVRGLRQVPQESVQVLMNLFVMNIE